MLLEAWARESLVEVRVHLAVTTSILCSQVDYSSIIKHAERIVADNKMDDGKFEHS
jgi:hypothetical protein